MSNIYCTARYHHGGVFRRSDTVTYANGQISEYKEDVDRFSYWDVIGTVKSLGYDVKKSVKVFYLEPGKTFGEGLKVLDTDNDVLHLTEHMRRVNFVDIYIEHLNCEYQKGDVPEALLKPLRIIISDEEEHGSGGGPPKPTLDDLFTDEEQYDRERTVQVGDLVVGEDGVAIEEEVPLEQGDPVEQEDGCDNEFRLDGEERLVDVRWCEDSDLDDELEVARQNLNDYEVRKNKSCSDDDIGVASSEDVREKGQTSGPNLDSDKVASYESDYFDSSDLGSFRDTEGSEEDDAQRVKFSGRNYNPRAPLTDFTLGLRFQDLKSFKLALSKLSTRERFEFKYIKNDAVRVRAICSAQGCKWVVLCSWCSTSKTFMVKTYISEHSCLPSSKNRKVPGKPAKKRKKEPLEGKNKSKLSKVGRIMTCGFCHKEGHNKSRCPIRSE